ncbi:MAG: methyltransferase domain-containing protein [Bacteroidota bacterium]
MSQKEKNAYILGTEQAELHRLGLQHQVWAGEARQAWQNAEFSAGQTILDLGCGPGFCTRELAYITGPNGQVLGVDKSTHYIDFLNKVSALHGLNIQTQACDFEEMEIEASSLDGAYCRWALAWLDHPEEIIAKVKQGLKTGGAFVVHEYYDWSIFQTEPYPAGLQKGIEAALQSFMDSPGDINIGRRLAALFEEQEMEVISIRPMSKLTTPDELTWQWPATFLHIYLPKLVDAGYLSDQEVEMALAEWDALAWIPGATCLCPQMIEVIAVKL